MSNVQTLLLDDIRASLIEKIRSGLNDNVLEQALALWLVPDSNLGLDATVLLGQLVAADRTPRETAALGFLANAVSLAESTKDDLQNDLRQLLGREPVVAGTPMPFCTNGLTLGGILLGIKAWSDSDLTAAREWITTCRNASSTGRGLGAWQEAFLCHVGEYTGLPWKPKDQSDETASVVTVAMESAGLYTPDDMDAAERKELAALNTIKAGTPPDIECAESIFRLTCIDWIRRSRPIANLRRISIPDVCNLLRRSGSGLQYWTWEDKPRTKTSQARKWHIDHEYHVQNFLWSILAPLFSDLTPEDYTVKIHTKQPRADLGVPSLRLIVEAKFWYSQHSSKKIIEEIAEDASLYLVPESRYQSIVPFIWDDGRRTEEHDGLISALRKFDGIEDAIVISRPGMMG
ncbi:Hypothetical protein PBC10988_25720 [Planctomycetales bacterium 10988]|nr:Hypothetical protein PBC10988_25720 [Planctomycetales bacterium 10988]